jgi:hypothetical protein
MPTEISPCLIRNSALQTTIVFTQNKGGEACGRLPKCILVARRWSIGGKDACQTFKGFRSGDWCHVEMAASSSPMHDGVEA